MTPGRSCLALAALLAGLHAPTTAPAQDYPARQVTIIVPFAPGGSADIGAPWRSLALAATHSTPGKSPSRTGL